MADSEIIRAIKLANNGHHESAAAIYQREANKERDPAEKRILWDAAEKARRIARSD